jgi:glycosyltransferase involved in cell wall biosynthesis
MKILQLIPNLGTGGAERFVCELANELNKQGEDCTIATLYNPNESDKISKSHLNNINMLSLGKKKGIDIRMFWKISKLIRKEKFEVVHAHIGAIKYILVASIFLRKVKFVTTIHSEASREAGNKIEKYIRAFMFKFGFCKAVTISEESHTSFQNFYGFNTEMVYNGVSDYKQKENIVLKNNNEELVFVHAASCQPVKNQELLFKSFAILAQEFDNVKLIWLGNNNMYKDLYKSLESYLSEKIIYGGEINNIRDYLAKADAFCLSSKMEGMPMSIIESFSVGCIPLCTPVGGIKNMIQSGENGILSEDLSVEAYYKMLKQFVQMDNAKKEQMKHCALESFDNYKIDTTAKKYIKLYKQ